VLETPKFQQSSALTEADVHHARVDAVRHIVTDLLGSRRSIPLGVRRHRINQPLVLGSPPETGHGEGR
jgi:hypothetical protein